jgi:hypothetical protein
LTGGADATAPTVGSFDVAAPASAAGQASVTVVYNDTSRDEGIGRVEVAGLGQDVEVVEDGLAFERNVEHPLAGIFADSTGGNGLQTAFGGTVYQTERYGNFSYAIPVKLPVWARMSRSLRMVWPSNVTSNTRWPGLLHQSSAKRSSTV